MLIPVSERRKYSIYQAMDPTVIACTKTLCIQKHVERPIEDGI
jgi:hypothetical protein